jgi:hypothetical protein
MERAMTWKAIAIAVTVMFLSNSAFAAENPFVGAWKMNREKSRITNTVIANQVQLIVIAPYGDNGWTRIQIDERDPLQSGREEHYFAKFDGKDYPSYGGDPRTMSLNRIDDRTVEQVTKRDGRVTSTSRITISADGKQMIVTSNGVNGRGDAYTDNLVIFDLLE